MERKALWEFPIMWPSHQHSAELAFCPREKATSRCRRSREQPPPHTHTHSHGCEHGMTFTFRYSKSLTWRSFKVFVLLRRERRTEKKGGRNANANDYRLNVCQPLDGGRRTGCWLIINPKLSSLAPHCCKYQQLEGGRRRRRWERGGECQRRRCSRKQQKTCAVAEEQVALINTVCLSTPALPQSVCWCWGVGSLSEAPQEEMEKHSQANKSIRIFKANWTLSARDLQRLLEHVSFFVLKLDLKVPTFVCITLEQCHIICITCGGEIESDLLKVSTLW